MSTINWTDQVTPLNAVNMNALEQIVRKNAASGYVGLDASSNIAFSATQQIVWNADTTLKRVGVGVLATDGFLRIGVNSANEGIRFYDGASNSYGAIWRDNTAGSLHLQGGAHVLLRPATAGGRIYVSDQTGVTDTNLYRQSAGLLQSDTDIEVRGGSAFRVRLGYVATPNAGGLLFGTSYDTNLYRAGAGQLKTDGSLYVVGTAGIGFVFNPPAASGQALASLAPGDTSYRFNINVNGQQQWGPGNAVGDTILYRSAAGVLKTDGALQTGSTILASAGSGNQVVLGYNGAAGAPAIAFGSTYDTAISRVAAGVVRTAALATTSYGTALPASPVDGQEFTLVDSLTNPTYQWCFRYNAGSSLSNKWEFIGGPPFLVVTFTGGETLANTNTWSTPPTLTDVVVPRGGQYWVEYGATLYAGPGGGSLMQVAVADATVSNTPVTSSAIVQMAAANAPATVGAAKYLVTIVAGHVLRLVYQQTVVNGQITQRFVGITPIRVS